MKRVILGVPRSGKTTEARKFGASVVHSDDFYRAGLSKGEQSARAHQVLHSEAEVAEGVMMLYGIRRALKADTRFKPAEVVTFLRKPLVELSPGQEKMAQQVLKAWEEVKVELVKRGVTVEEK